MAAMKSAVELALEKLGTRSSAMDTTALTDTQRQEIGELRKLYEAKIAEKEIMMQAEIRKLLQRHPPQEVAAMGNQLREQFQQAKKLLQEELETKIAAVRAPN